MYKILRIGDYHCQISNLKDCENLKDYIVLLAEQEKVSIIEFLGDLFHTHAVKRLEVENFWIKFFNELHEKLPKVEVRVLVGNHDMTGAKEKEKKINALNIFQTGENHINRIIINKPMILGEIGYVPYFSDKEEFIREANKLDTRLLIAHQTFTGAQYENGFFSEEGIDPVLLKHEQIVSGHIHIESQIGKCFYPGTPKWDTMSDANQRKGIWIFEHEENGKYTNKTFFSTENIVTPIKTFLIKEGDELPQLDKNSRNYVVLEGKSAWITKTKNKLSGLANVKAKPVDKKTKLIDNNINSLEKYMEMVFEPVHGITKQQIKEFLVAI